MPRRGKEEDGSAVGGALGAPAPAGPIGFPVVSADGRGARVEQGCPHAGAPVFLLSLIFHDWAYH